MKKLNKTVVQRLQKSKQAFDQVCLADGKQYGRKWAENRAETIELQRLEAVLEVAGWLTEDPTSAYSLAERLVFAIDADCYGDRTAADDFWVNHGPFEALPSAAFVEGFAEGAMEVWSEVEAEVLA